MAKKTTTPKKKSPRKKKSLEMFQHSESDLFRYILSQIGDEVMITGSDGRICFVNNAAVKGLGYPFYDIVGQPITKFLKKKFSLKKWTTENFVGVKKAGGPVRTIVERVIKGGKTQVIEVTAVYLCFESSEYILSVARNITDKIVLENKLKETSELYEWLSEQAGEGIFMLNALGYITYNNKAAADIIGRSPSETVGTHFQSYVDRKSLPAAWDSFKKLKKGDSVIRLEVNVVNKKKEIVPIELTASPIKKDGKMFQVHTIMRDISRRKQVEHLLHESEKMNALHNFISGTTHEIQSPLQALFDRSVSLIDKYKNVNFEYIGYKEFKDIIRTLEHMRDQVKYCFDTANRLISLSKQRIGISDESCDSNEVIKEVIGRLKHNLTETGIKMKTQFDKKLSKTSIGRIELIQVIDNILTNALQSMPDEGVIDIKTFKDKENEYNFIEIKDEGIGIADEDLKRVFEPFFTTKRRGLEKNSGLGLSIVYSIVKAYQGDINIRSSLRRGTTIKIILPIFRKENQ